MNKQDELLGFSFPNPSEKSIIKALGVGGGGSNAVNHMFRRGIKGVEFVVCNTDNQALAMSPIPNKIQIGKKLAEGRGAGSIPDVGRRAAEESLEELREMLDDGTKMLFITAGMGGGTGTGAAPVIAKMAKEMGILTVGIATLPFNFEGRRRKQFADEGIQAFKNNVDTLLVISNDQLREIYGNLSLTEAFGKADDILTSAAKGIAEIITVPGYVNVDFEDVKTVMTNGGTAVMGASIKSGPDRAKQAAEEVLISPLLDNSDVHGAEHLLLYISYGSEEPSLDEITDITDHIQTAAGMNASIIWGTGKDENLNDAICLTLIATGFESGRSKEVISGFEFTNRVQAPEKKIIHFSNEATERLEEPSLNESPSNEPMFEVASIPAPTNVFDLPIKEEIPQDNLFTLTKLEDLSSEPQNELKRFDFDALKTNSEHSDLENREPVNRVSVSDRRQSLEALTANLRRPSDLSLIGKQPAFERRNVQLVDADLISQNKVSGSSLDADNQLQKNRFLHDSVD